MNSKTAVTVGFNNGSKSFFRLGSTMGAMRWLQLVVGWSPLMRSKIRPGPKSLGGSRRSHWVGSTLPPRIAVNTRTTYMFGIFRMEIPNKNLYISLTRYVWVSCFCMWILKFKFRYTEHSQQLNLGPGKWPAHNSDMISTCNSLQTTRWRDFEGKVREDTPTCVRTATNNRCPPFQNWCNRIAVVLRLLPSPHPIWATGKHEKKLHIFEIPGRGDSLGLYVYICSRLCPCGTGWSLSTLAAYMHHSLEKNIHNNYIIICIYIHIHILFLIHIQSGASVLNHTKCHTYTK